MVSIVILALGTAATGVAKETNRRGEGGKRAFSGKDYEEIVIDPADTNSKHRCVGK